MKPCAYKGQSLIDHAIGSYKALQGNVSESYYKVITKKLYKYGIILDINSVKEIVKDVVVLHDIGKAGEYYQEQFDDNCNSIKSEFSFIYHELGSALFFYYDYKLDELENAEKVKPLLTLAVLNHLNAIRGLPDYSLVGFPEGFKISMIKLNKYGNVLLKDLMEKGVISKQLNAKDYNFDDYRNMLYVLARKHDEYLKLYNLFLAPIMLGDNLDSRSRNTGNKTRFVRMLEEELNEGSTL
ncbi:MAG: CRISPR-associated endonuclease Cas3'' [Caldisphaera sp.]